MKEKVFGGYINDIEKLKKCASGGLATAMMEKAIGMGTVVYGVAYAGDFKSAEYIRADHKDVIEKLRSSKYIKAKLNPEILSKLANDLEIGKTVLFTGLPCDVNALKQYLQKHMICTDHLLCVDLICGGPTIPEVAKQYISGLEKKYKSKVVAFSVRYKNPYWTPPYVYAVFENGKVFKRELYDTQYGIAFSMLAGSACYKCTHKADRYQSDITIGDYWGATPEDACYNPYGTSIAFVHTEKGEAYLKSLDNFNLFVADYEKAVKGNPMYKVPTKFPKDGDLFRKHFVEKGLDYAVAKYLGMKRFVPMWVKRIRRTAIRKLRK